MLDGESLPLFALTDKKKMSFVQCADKCKSGNIPRWGCDRDSLLNISKHTPDNS